MAGLNGLEPAAWSEFDDVDVQLLSLLLAGFTDQAVAKHLETSLRTVQRRVRHLMNVAGGET
jgi:DNA-binding NarL/FixJ family response regulator